MPSLLGPKQTSPRWAVINALPAGKSRFCAELDRSSHLPPFCLDAGALLPLPPGSTPRVTLYSFRLNCLNCRPTRVLTLVASIHIHPERIMEPYEDGAVLSPSPFVARVSS